MGKTASILVNVFDGTRRPMGTDIQLLIRIIDGNQKQISSVFKNGPSVRFKNLPFYNNLGDLYTVIVSADGFLQAGFRPVHVSSQAEQVVDLMLLPKNNKFNFNSARWETLKQTHPALSQLLVQGAASEDAARNRYNELMEDRPNSLAALLNITTAMADIHLPLGTPFGYLKELIWDDTLAQDRFYAWGDQTLVDQVKRATAQGVFQPEIGAGFFHPGATSSYKQVQFGEANVQLTFHEKDINRIGDVDCVRVEPDIDQYQDPAAHTLLEVFPHAISGGRTDPKTIYILRWIAGRHSGVPEFNPPYTIES